MVRVRLPSPTTTSPQTESSSVALSTTWPAFFRNSSSVSAAFGGSPRSLSPRMSTRPLASNRNGPKR
jgi:hypothetical protein